KVVGSNPTPATIKPQKKYKTTQYKGMPDRIALNRISIIGRLLENSLGAKTSEIACSRMATADLMLCGLVAR
ncbi:MAG: hypothetical protein ACSHXH_16055, partial [Marivita sp.]|uniref:hypothetical protein n=1 Tax=Marivita sp. TaxID=2003365 RepID=UPI003EF2A2A2